MPRALVCMLRNCHVASPTVWQYETSERRDYGCSRLQHRAASDVCLTRSESKASRSESKASRSSPLRARVCTVRVGSGGDRKCVRTISVSNGTLFDGLSGPSARQRRRPSSQGRGRTANEFVRERLLRDSHQAHSRPFEAYR